MRIPLRTPFGGWTERRALLLGGSSGWGECSPLAGYAADPALARRAAEEAALQPWPVAVRKQVSVCDLIPAWACRLAAERARAAVAAGFSTVKLKVGTEGDLDRVAAVRDALGPAVRLRLDANGAWDLDTAAWMISRLARYDLELVEQPVSELDDLARLRRRVAVRLGADECLRTLDDARHLARLQAADVAVVKVQTLGGTRSTIEIIETVGIPVIVSSMLETSIGLAVGLALAASLPELPYSCGLGTAALLDGDVVSEPLV
ncbi:MAG: enolase C-terminal domain-like protein, partial [Acidimicrobiia bacterium]